MAAQYGSTGGPRMQLLTGNDFTCDLEAGGLVQCANRWPSRLSANESVQDVYGRVTTVPFDVGYTLVVECQKEEPVIELTKGHYGEVILRSYDTSSYMCLDYDPLCVTYSVGSTVVPDSRLVDGICSSQGYGAGYAVPWSINSSAALPQVVFGQACTEYGFCERRERVCDLNNGDHLLAVRCLDAFDACDPEHNTCFWNASCIDLPLGQHSLCQCPPGYEGDGHTCTDIDECEGNVNPCFNPSSCVPAPAPSILGEPQVDSPTCAPCPEGTEDLDETQPGRTCQEKDGCIPNFCNNATLCSDVLRSPDSMPGYTCGPCGMGYVASPEPDCVQGNKTEGSLDCCIDGDACIGNPCQANEKKKRCLDLPAPAPVDLGYTCEECPVGTEYNSTSNKCQDVDSCSDSANPCDTNAHCTDLPAPSLSPFCRCHAGYYQNASGVAGTCVEVDICSADSSVCGLGRSCLDLPAPHDPYMYNAIAAICSNCAPGYMENDSFVFTLEDYLLSTQGNFSLRRDCIDYDGCANTPDACYKFPDNSSYDVECEDVPAAEYMPGSLPFRCGSCPTGMVGNGYGSNGCMNLDRCTQSPCDTIALNCTDVLPPEDGFYCSCPPRTIGVGLGNSQCLDIDSCQNGSNPCMFPDLCVDLPYDSDKLYRCECPFGTYHVNERACGDIHGCLYHSCFGECTDVPYTDLPQYPGSDGTDVVCEPCPHGTLGDGIGSNGCEEIDLCSSFAYVHLLCYNDPTLGLVATCVDVPHEELLPSDSADLYRCICPDGMNGTGKPFSGCTNIDYCDLDVCGQNTVCEDYEPPSTGYSCTCAAGYIKAKSSGECVEQRFCDTKEPPCDRRMTCVNLGPPSDPYSTYYPVANCSSCPIGTLGYDTTVYLSHDVLTDFVTCAEIDGCLWNDTCWVNPLTGTSLCQDVPSSELHELLSTGYETRCETCPHGLEGTGRMAEGYSGCTEIDGCSVNRCYARVECYDILWSDLLPTQPADDYTCGKCPGELQGDGKLCTGGCDFDTDRCGGEITGSWFREVGSLSKRSAENINKDSDLGDAPLFDHSKPFSTRGRFLAVTARAGMLSTSKFSLPLVAEAGGFDIIFYVYFHGIAPGKLYVRQYTSDGRGKTLWEHDSNIGPYWLAVKDVLAFSILPFYISFEFAADAHQQSNLPFYVAIDDIYIDKLEDTQCNTDQVCSPLATQCMKYPDGYSTRKGDYVCFCPPSYTGRFCETFIDACASSPCMGNSTCVSTDGDYECFCPPTLTGRSCSTDINECESTAICSHGSTCINSHAGYQCLCSAGFTGSSCQFNINDCNLVDCGHGVCYDLHKEYSCVCKEGWTGSDCSTKLNQCLPDPCRHGAQCTDDLGPFVCQCPVGYEGSACEVNIDDCKGVACRQGATCADLVNGFECSCPAGYGGKLCDRDVWACSSSTCNGNGICHEGLSDIRCLCTKPGCQGMLDCEPKRGRHVCECNEGYRGSHCEIEPDPCYSNPCFQGRCMPQGLYEFTCACEQGYAGQLCDLNIDDCANAPCLNSGQCFSMDGQFKCKCLPGYEGETCAIDVDECQHVLCKNGAKCLDLINGFECDCSEEFVGRLCDVKAFGLVVANFSTAGLPSALQSLEQGNFSYCGTWLDLSHLLKLQILGYSTLSAVMIVLVLLLIFLHRMKSIDKHRETSSFISHPHPVSRYFDIYDGRRELYCPHQYFSSTLRNADFSPTARAWNPKSPSRRRDHRYSTNSSYAN